MIAVLVDVVIVIIRTNAFLQAYLSSLLLSKHSKLYLPQFSINIHSFIQQSFGINYTGTILYTKPYVVIDRILISIKLISQRSTPVWELGQREQLMLICYCYLHTRTLMPYYEWYLYFKGLSTVQLLVPTKHNNL